MIDEFSAQLESSSEQKLSLARILEMIRREEFSELDDLLEALRRVQDQSSQGRIVQETIEIIEIYKRRGGIDNLGTIHNRAIRDEAIRLAKRLSEEATIAVSPPTAEEDTFIAPGTEQLQTPKQVYEALRNASTAEAAIEILEKARIIPMTKFSREQYKPLDPQDIDKTIEILRRIAQGDTEIQVKGDLYPIHKFLPNIGSVLRDRSLVARWIEAAKPQKKTEIEQMETILPSQGPEGDLSQMPFETLVDFLEKKQDSGNIRLGEEDATQDLVMRIKEAAAKRLLDQIEKASSVEQLLRWLHAIDARYGDLDNPDNAQSTAEIAQIIERMLKHKDMQIAEEIICSNTIRQKVFSLAFDEMRKRTLVEARKKRNF